ncbi:hypothetical protein E2C01_009433 [Portunus trituberculatus]|uniref:Uncharacterized protein n=1 Tax=Portunus trituberculatus TaxID=210409 RepID=A0A5B7D5J2_PORTR|nr:hypothetical protein [Portunus trituberculatus]
MEGICYLIRAPQRISLQRLRYPPRRLRPSKCYVSDKVKMKCIHSMKSIQGRAHSGIPMSATLPVRLPIIRLSTDPPPIC